MNGKKIGSMVVEDKTLFFISYGDLFPALYKLDLSGERIECFGEVPWENYLDESAVFGKINDVIIIAPRWHKRKFIKYDIKSSQFQVALLEQDVWDDDFSVAAFSNAVRYGDSLFFIGNKNGLIVEYKKERDQFCIHNLAFPGELEKEDLSFFWNSFIFEEHILYLPIRKGGILWIDLNDFHSGYFKISDEYQCFSMVRMEDSFLILPFYGNKIGLFCLKTQKVSFVECPIKNAETPFMTAVDFGKEILLVPMADQTIYAIDKSSYEISARKQFKLETLGRKEGWRQFFSICKDAVGNTYLQKNEDRKLWIFRKEGRFEEVVFSVPFTVFQEAFKGAKVAKSLLWIENTEMGIESILHILKADGYGERAAYENCGASIWGSLKRDD